MPGWIEQIGRSTNGTLDCKILNGWGTGALVNICVLPVLLKYVDSPQKWYYVDILRCSIAKFFSKHFGSCMLNFEDSHVMGILEPDKKLFGSNEHLWRSLAGRGGTASPSSIGFLVLPTPLANMGLQQHWRAWLEVLVLYFLNKLIISSMFVYTLATKIDVRNHSFSCTCSILRSKRSTAVFEVCAEFERFEAWSICQWLHGHVWGGGWEGDFWKLCDFVTPRFFLISCEVLISPFILLHLRESQRS